METRTPLDIINERGWCKRHFENHTTGEVCIMGAYRVSQGADPEAFVVGAYEWSVKVGKIAEELFPGRQQSITKPISANWAPFFNDHPDTTLEDIKLVLKHAEID